MSLAAARLVIAVHRGDLAALARSLADGARPDATVSGVSPLHVAISFFDAGIAVAMAQALIAAGASVDARTCAGRAPLHWAAAAASSGACCEALLLAGASVNAVDGKGNTPLHDAARHGGAMDSAAQLLAAGADVGRRNSDGKTAAELALSLGRDDLAVRIRDAARWAGLRRAALTAWCCRWER